MDLVKYFRFARYMPVDDANIRGIRPEIVSLSRERGFIFYCRFVTGIANGSLIQDHCKFCRVNCC